LKSRPGRGHARGLSGSPTRLCGLLDDYRRSDRRPLIKEGHGAQRDVHAAVGSTCNVGPWTVDGAPGSVVNEVTAIVVEHRVLHPGAGVPVGAALWPGRDELIRGVLRLDSIRLCVLSVTTISLPSAFAAGAGVGAVTIGLAVAVGSAGTGGAVAAATDGARVADGVGSSATGSGVGK